MDNIGLYSLCIFNNLIASDSSALSGLLVNLYIYIVRLCLRTHKKNPLINNFGAMNLFAWNARDTILHISEFFLKNTFSYFATFMSSRTDYLQNNMKSLDSTFVNSRYWCSNYCVLQKTMRSAFVICISVLMGKGFSICEIELWIGRSECSAK